MRRRECRALVGLLERELLGASDQALINTLHVRLAMLHWDVMGDESAAADHLQAADHDHPAVIELSRQLLLSRGETAVAAEIIEEQVKQFAPDPESAPLCAALLTEAACLRLFACDGADEALRDVRAAMALGVYTPELAALSNLSVALTRGTSALAATETAADSPLDLLGAIGFWDEEDQPEQAVDALRRAWQAPDADPLTADLLLEIGLHRPDLVDRGTVLRHKLERLLLPMGVDAYALATAFELSRRYIEHGEPQYAETSLLLLERHRKLGDAASEPTLERVATASNKRDLAALQRKQRPLARAYLELAELVAAPLQRSLRLRASLLLARTAELQSEAFEILEQLVASDPDDQTAAVAFQRYAVASRQPQRLIPYLEQSGRASPERSYLLHWAAIIAEVKVGDYSLAANLRQECGSQRTDPLEMGELQRLYRRIGSSSRLGATYRQEATLTDDTDWAATLMAASATLALDSEQYNEARHQAKQALESRPHDPQAIAILSLTSRLLGHRTQLVETLRLQAQSTNSQETKAECLREIALIKRPSSPAGHGMPPATPHVRGADYPAALSQSAGETLPENLAADIERFRQTPTDTHLLERIEKTCRRGQYYLSLANVYGLALQHCLNGGTAHAPAELYIRRAKVLARHLGRPLDAISDFSAALELEPNNDPLMRRLADLLRDQQDWRSLAERHHHRATLLRETDPRRVESFRTALSIAERHLPVDDADLFRFAAALFAADPSSESLFARLARHYQRTGAFEVLAALYHRRLAHLGQSESSRRLRYELAELLERHLRDADGAAAQYELVLQLDEHDERSLRSLARIYEATQHWERCLEVLQDLLMIEPDPENRALFFFKCGSIFETHSNDRQRAIRFYQSALEASRSCLPALHGLRALYRRDKNWTQVLHTLELELDHWSKPKERAGILSQMAQVHAEVAEESDETAQDRATELYEKALHLFPECTPALRALFEIYCRTHQRQRAKLVAARLGIHMSSEPDESRAKFFYQRGCLLSDTPSTVGAAAESFAAALEIDPSNIDALERLTSLVHQLPVSPSLTNTFRQLEQRYREQDNGRALAHVLVAAGAHYERAYDVPTALAQYEAAEKQDPSLLLPVSAQAKLLVLLGRPDAALALLERYTDRAKDAAMLAQAWMLAGSIAATMFEDLQLSCAYYSKVLEVAPAHHEARLAFAEHLFDLGRSDQAEALLLRNLADEQPPSQRTAARSLLCRALLRFKQADEQSAVRLLQECINTDPTCAEAALVLARHLHQAGHMGEAVTLLRQTLAACRETLDAHTERELDLCHAIARLMRSAPEGDQHSQPLADSSSGDINDQLFIVARLALDIGRVAEAKEQLRLVLQEYPMHPTALWLDAEIQGSINPQRRQRVDRLLSLLGYVEAPVTQPDEEPHFPPTAGWKEQSTERLVIERVGYPPQSGRVRAIWDLAQPWLEQVFVPEDLGAVVKAPGDLPARPWIEAIFADAGSTIELWQLEGLGGRAICHQGRMVIDLARMTEVAELTFVVARCLWLSQHGCQLLAYLDKAERRVVTELVAHLSSAPEEHAANLVRELGYDPPPSLLQSIVQSQAGHSRLPLADMRQTVATWLQAIDCTADCYGFVACQDIGVSLRLASKADVTVVDDRQRLAAEAALDPKLRPLIDCYLDLQY